MTGLGFTVFHGFGGSGGGALGFLAARARLFDRDLSFRCLGSVDLDPVACEDFERFTGSRSLCRDITTVTPAELLAFVGERPDVGFCSAPCVGASRLLSNALAKTEKYETMNRLALVWTRLVLAAARGVDIIGPDNDATIDRWMRSADGVVFAWGAHRTVGKRGRELFARARALGVEPLCIGMTKSGEPRHPLMVGYAVAPTPWSPT